MKLSLINKRIKQIKIGDIVYDKSTNNDCNFRYCKISRIDEHIWGYWYKTLEDVKRNIPSSGGTLPGKIEDVVKV